MQTLFAVCENQKIRRSVWARAHRLEGQMREANLPASCLPPVFLVGKKSKVCGP